MFPNPHAVFRDHPDREIPEPLLQCRLLRAADENHTVAVIRRKPLKKVERGFRRSRKVRPSFSGQERAVIINQQKTLARLAVLFGYVFYHRRLFSILLLDASHLTQLADEIGCPADDVIPSQPFLHDRVPALLLFPRHFERLFQRVCQLAAVIRIHDNRFSEFLRGAGHFTEDQDAGPVGS